MSHLDISRLPPSLRSAVEAEFRSGDLIFEPSNSRGGSGRGRRTPAGFLALRDVKEVEGILRRLARPAAT